MDGGDSTNEPGQQDWVYHVAAQLAAADLPSRDGGDGKDGKKRWWLPVVVGVAAVAVIGAVAFALTRGNDDDAAAPTTVGNSVAPTLATIATASTAAPVTTAPTTTAPPAAASTTVAVVATESPTTVAVPTTLAPSTTVAPTTTVPADPNGPPVRWAVFSDGQVTLQGKVPDQATADEIASKAAAVVGAENVHQEYTIDPTAPRPDYAPLYVNDSILFGAGLSDLNAKAKSTLDLGVTLLNLYPKVTFDIEGHTDSTGTEAENLALSQKRVDAIVRYLTDRGIDPSRLTAVAKGESQPIADNSTEAGRAQNRRIEIQVNNLLG